MSDLTLGEAAQAIGVGADTLRRWDCAGKLRTVRDDRKRRRRRRDDRRELRADRKGKKHEYGAGKSWGDLWKGGGRGALVAR